MYRDQERQTNYLVVEQESFDEVVEGAVPPVVDVEWTVRNDGEMNPLLYPTRLQSAERAVVEAELLLLSLLDMPFGSTSEDARSSTWDRIDAQEKSLHDSARRLRDLRAHIGEETCKAKTATQVGSYSTLRGGYPDIACHLPRGHDGEHEGDLGAWRWR